MQNIIHAEYLINFGSEKVAEITIQKSYIHFLNKITIGTMILDYHRISPKSYFNNFYKYLKLFTFLLET